MRRLSTPIDALISRRNLRLYEVIPWAVAVAVYFAFPEYLPLGAQIIIMVIFTLSLDLVMGYAGIIILGHAAFFGLGAYAVGLLAVAGWKEPLSGLLFAAAAAGLLGALTGVVILRTKGLSLLMLGMAVSLILAQLANRLSSITGGFDGLRGITIDPIFGVFDFDFFGKTAYLYGLAVLFIAWLFVRQVVHAPFGRSLIGIRENPVRMEANGAPVQRRKLVAFILSAALAGVAGGLSTQTTQFVSLSTLSFELSGTVLVMLILGGAGRLYGAFVAPPLYMIAQDAFAKGDPVYWHFWLGLMLILVVLFVRGGLLGIIDELRRLLGISAGLANLKKQDHA
ncbi:branched-chain amino acid ABC transporter permease [Pseudorhodoplanes sp.]|uniref:branched-chain amino acid ABC transporter permease n=1 Tax=Pseudorhodoplanes sp. TaxID=1934341 RepID=UPI003D0FC669